MDLKNIFNNLTDEMDVFPIMDDDSVVVISPPIMDYDVYGNRIRDQKRYLRLFSRCDNTAVGRVFSAVRMLQLSSRRVLYAKYNELNNGGHEYGCYCILCTLDDGCRCDECRVVKTCCVCTNTDSWFEDYSEVCRRCYMYIDVERDIDIDISCLFEPMYVRPFPLYLARMYYTSEYSGLNQIMMFCSWHAAENSHFDLGIRGSNEAAISMMIDTMELYVTVPQDEGPERLWRATFLAMCKYLLLTGREQYVNPNFGHEFYILGGGELNPGPVFSTLRGVGVGTARVVRDVGVGTAKAAFNFIFPTYNEWYEKMSRFAHQSADYGLVIVHLIRLYTSVLDFLSCLLHRWMAVTSLDLYTRVVVMIKNCYDTFVFFSEKLEITLRDPVEYARAQTGPFETFCIASFLSAILPKRIHAIIKDIPTFTNFKLLDDATWVFDFFSFLVSLPRRLCTMMLPRNDKTQGLFEMLAQVEENLPFCALSKYHFMIKELLDEASRKPSLVGDEAFQYRVMMCKRDYIKYKNAFLEDRKELPGYMLDHDKRFRNLCVKVEYMKSNVRIEPVACIFAGLRGTGKSNFMSILTKGFEVANSVYVHTSQEEKDFHDQYDNEDIYVVDDIGQKGVWQWANVINFVSSTKCPLLCADVDKKGTKFFTSRLILATTNNIDITLTANCGITDKAAFHRRLIKWDFDNVRFVNGLYSGEIVVSKFDLNRNQYVRDVAFKAIDGSFDYVSVAEYMKHLIQQKKDHFAALEVRQFNFGAIAQNLTEVITIAATKMKAYFNEIWQHCGRAADFMFSDDMQEAVGTATVHLGRLCYGSMIAMTIYYCVSESFKQVVDAIPDSTTKVLEYKAVKKPKISIVAATPQSVQSMFEKRGEVVDIPQLRRISEQVVVVEAQFVRLGKQLSTIYSGMISGRYITAPMHAINLDVGDKVIVTVYRSPTNICYDKISTIVVYANHRDDIVVLALPLYLPKYFKNVGFVKDTNVTDLVLCTPSGIVDIGDKLHEVDCRITYKDFKTDYHGTIGEHSRVYDYERDGACGSMLMTKDGMLLGHHVAAVSLRNNGREMGCAKLFTNKTRDKIYELFNEKIDYEVQAAKRLVEGSITKIDTKEYHHVSTDSKYVPSLLHGVFEEVRAPANLNVYGRDTIKIFSEKSRKPVAPLDIAGVEYAERYIEEMMPSSSCMQTEREIVLGDAFVGRIDPDSSVGHGLSGTKRDHLDYIEGRIGPAPKRMIREMCDGIVDGSFKYDVYYAESLKDELKNKEKVQKPRVFKAGPLILTLLYRFFFARLISATSQKRMTTGVMVGINPLSVEWDEFARRLMSFSVYMFDGDWAWWDGGMQTQMQEAQCRVMKKKCFRHEDNVIFNQIFGTKYSEEDYEKIFDLLLVYLYMTPTITLDEAFITTHSMPSGCGVTAFFNSWINKLDGAYIFHRLYEEKFGKRPRIDEYMDNVMDCVYGDDKITAVRSDIKDWYNGATFSRIAREMGLDFTPADKGAWTYETRSLFDCSFLKRGFYFHPKLGRVVAPLERVSMTGTLNFVSDGFRNEELSGVKLRNFQREAYLHYRDYDDVIDRVYKFAASRGILVHQLSEDYLMELYRIGEYGNFLELN